MNYAHPIGGPGGRLPNARSRRRWGFRSRAGVDYITSEITPLSSSPRKRDPGPQLGPRFRGDDDRSTDALVSPRPLGDGVRCPIGFVRTSLAGLAQAPKPLSRPARNGRYSRRACIRSSLFTVGAIGCRHVGRRPAQNGLYRSCGGWWFKRSQQPRAGHKAPPEL